MSLVEANELILGILHERPCPQMQGMLEVLPEKSWGVILRESLRHCIPALVYHRLMTTFWDVHVPERVMSRLKSEYLCYTAKNIRYYHELDRLLQSLGEGAPVLLLKGVMVESTTYQFLSVRALKLSENE